MDSQRAESAEGGEKTGFDKFKHCRGRKRHLVADTLGFLCGRTVTAACVSDRAAGRQVLAPGRGAPPVPGPVLGRRRIRQRRRRQHHHLGPGEHPGHRPGRQAHRRPEGLQDPAPPLGDRADQRMAVRAPQAGPRLRTPRRDRGGHDRPRNDRRDGQPSRRRHPVGALADDDHPTARRRAAAPGNHCL